VRECKCNYCGFCLSKHLKNMQREKYYWIICEQLIS
jgi:hypothetical protein